ncbi:phosphoethanolamine transferase [Shewanella fidelis]|uniref:Phosphoethanolamine--lipid A transferase n=1 Tax=Shewanella fidelis TaxID=173509 RepID=A0AAW8NMX5_9GAMM|nr:phosphoethanolamine--lipid A transferase [Shewanella fidelis]MDR8523700.1 phosphoethanolamine--lipid A transferase [Shewanella fidelis]MDW4810247.1 phosphoethanolamine--lipid A transferase [Shewanella fidelis]MDW4814392.1 phosphoethanolamine--lipid A transferase [Shewanella fidelis]MDW4818483.1 phosphoethanolamine--lipid A transferase [Shewanella fidelis]MDW4823865.1 phosphoethanolamine--lipid A transferase [Shewanella fidelis]
MLSRLKTLSSRQFTFILAVYYVCVFNIPFFAVVKHGIDKQTDVNMLFVATIPLFLVFALSFVFSLFSVKYLAKPFFIVLTLISANVFFAEFQYGAVIDYGMIENLVQTNRAEASTYLNWVSVLSFCITGVIPALLIYKVNIHYQPFAKELLRKALFMLAMLAGILVIAAFYYENYLAFGRNNNLIKRSIIPTYFIGSAAKFININYVQTPLEYRQLGLDAEIVAKKTKPNLVVMVVGETARAQNYSYYGYAKPTNSHTKEQQLLVFKDTHSCGTATAVSLPCMFSRMDRKNYNERRAKAQDSVIDVLDHAGVQLRWLDNDSGCKGVCNNIQHILVDNSKLTKWCNGDSCFDEVLLQELDKQLSSIKTKDTLIVLHLIGSHGPTYYQRYPEQHRVFKPDCQRSDIQNCTQQELFNTYDNTILYTDYILSRVVKRLKQINQFDTAMVYMSDHGESLGESGLYLHGAPYAIAPKQQTHIPFLVWLPEDFAKQNKLSLSCLQQQANSGGFSHDNLFDSLLGLMNVTSTVYKPQGDIFARCKQQ